MRLDHLLSKEKSRAEECVSLFSYQGASARIPESSRPRNQRFQWTGRLRKTYMRAWLYRDEAKQNRGRDKAVHERSWQLKDFRCRCVRGKHPFPSRTRRLRPGRPMVLRWRRRGRAGGRRNKKERAGDFTSDHCIQGTVCFDD